MKMPPKKGEVKRSDGLQLDAIIPCFDWNLEHKKQLDKACEMIREILDKYELKHCPINQCRNALDVKCEFFEIHICNTERYVRNSSTNERENYETVGDLVKIIERYNDNIAKTALENMGKIFAN